MAQKRRKRNRKWLKALFLLILIVVAVAVVYLVWENYFKDADSVSGDTSVVSTENSTSVPATVVQDTEEFGKGGEEKVVEKKEEVTQYEGEDPNIGGNLTGVITYAGVSNGTLMIRVNIDQYVSGGECKMSLKRNGNIIYSDSAAIIDSAATATCEGFNVPASSLGTGNIAIVISLSADGKSGEIQGGVEL